MTAQIPLSTIHSAARVIGARRGAVKASGGPIEIYGRPAPRSAQWHREDEGGQFYPWVSLADAGV